MRFIRFTILILALCVALLPSQRAFAESKSDFLYLYKTAWERANFDYRLFEITEKIFSEQTDGMSFTSAGLRLEFNRHSLINMIQRGVVLDFGRRYDRLLNFIKKRLPENHVEIRNAAEKKFLDNTLQDIKPNQLNPFYALYLLIAGTVIFLCRGFLARTLMSLLGKTKRLAQSIRIIFAVTGIALLLFGVYNASRSVALTGSMTRKLIYERTKNFYSVELPTLYKDSLN